MSAVDTTVIGRILTMQRSLQSASDPRRIGELLCLALDGVPGLTASAFYINQQRIAQSAGATIAWPTLSPETEKQYSAAPKFLWLPLLSNFKTYGCLALRLSDHDQIQAYLPLIENTASNIALLLENKHQAKELTDLTKHLENQTQSQLTSLQQSEARLSQALKAAKCGLWEWDLASGQVYFGPNYYLIAGYQPDTFPHDFEEWRKRVHPEDIEPTEKLLQDYLAGKTDSFSVEFRFRTATDNWMWILAQGEIVARDSKGQPIRISGLHVDITEQKNIESALKESEDRFRRLTENAKDAIYRMRLPSGKYEYMSKAAEDLFGYTPDDFYSSDTLIQKIIHPDWQEYFKIQWTNLLEGNMSPTYEYQIKHKSGETKWLHQRNVLICDEDGRPSAIEGIVTDITERKNIEQNLKENEQKYRSLLDNQKDAVFLHQLQPEGFSCFTEVNAMAVERYGYSRAEFLQLSPQDITLVDDAERHGSAANRKQLLEQGQAVFEATHIKKSGERFPVEISSSILDLLGKKYILATVRDISERKAIEQERELSNERFMTVLNSIDASIYVADIETFEILFMNQNMIKDFGQDYTGQTCWQVFRGDSGPCSDCNNKYLLDETGKPAGVQVWQGENPITGNHYINHDRAIRWIDGRMAKIQIATDISEIKKMETQLRQKYKMEAVGVMAGGVAHDFNNHLAIILGNVELSQMKTAKESPISTHLKDAKTAIIRARDLVHQILIYSRQGVLQDLKPIQLSQVIEETMQLLRSTIPTSVSIEKDLAKSITINADPTQIQELLINLCNNAVHAMADEGQLRVRLSSIAVDPQAIPQRYEISPGPFARISVEDNGTGMAPDILEKAFDPFFTTKDVGDGTGMGLAVVHGIIESHGGFITVESSPEKGSRFDIYFPALELQLPEIATEAPGQLKGTESILFLDDEEMLVDVWSRILKEYGYQITATTDSREALELISQNPDKFDLLITDQTMPHISGKELIKRLLDLRPDLPTILCTGYSNKVSEEEIAELGIKAFCLKPLEPIQFAQAVRHVLDEAKAKSIS